MKKYKKLEGLNQSKALENKILCIKLKTVYKYIVHEIKKAY